MTLEEHITRLEAAREACLVCARQPGNEINQGRADAYAVEIAALRELNKKYLLYPREIEILPRDPESRPADPIAQVLELCATPWILADIWGAMRSAGVTVHHKMESETAAALHFLTCVVLEHPKDWRTRATAKLKEMIELKKKRDAMEAAEKP